MPQIAEGKHLSTLSIKKRGIRLEELSDAKDCLEWIAKNEKNTTIERENIISRRRELERLEEATQEIYALRQERNETKNTVIAALKNETEKISQHAGEVFLILGFQEKRVVLLAEKQNQVVCVRETKDLEVILSIYIEYFEKEKQKYNNLMFWLPKKKY